MYNKFYVFRLVRHQDKVIGRFCIKLSPPPYFQIGSNDTEAECMSLKVIINDIFTVIVIYRHITTNIISNIIIFSSVITVVIISFKMT